MDLGFKIYSTAIVSALLVYQSSCFANDAYSMQDESYLNSVPKYMLPLIYSQGRLEQKTEDLKARVDENTLALKELRGDMSQRFDAAQVSVNKRFDEAQASVNKRFDEAQASVDKRFDEAQVSVDKRFDEAQASIDKRFDAAEASVDKRFDGVDDRLDRVERTLWELGANLTASIEGLRLTIQKMEDRHEAFVNRTEARLDKLEAHWSYNFSDFVVYNPLTYAALGAAAGALKWEGAGGALYGAYGLYGVSALFLDQVVWGLIAPSVPASLSHMMQQGVTGLAFLGIYVLHVNQGIIAPKITLGNIASIAVIGGALTNGKHILSWLGSPFQKNKD